MQKRREKIIKFIASEHKKTGKAPSIRKICTTLGLCNRELYEAFPGGGSEMCSAAGVPLNNDSFRKMVKANQKRKAISAEKNTEDEKLNALREEEKQIAKEVRHLKAKDEVREAIRTHYLEKAKTSGLRDIFSSPEKMLNFTTNTYQRGSRILYDADILDSFTDYCRRNNWPLAKRLYRAVGPLEDYEAAIDERETQGLDEYIQERLVDFLLEREAEEEEARALARERAMQVKFEAVLRNFRCECGRRITATVLDHNELICQCGPIWSLTCVNCRHTLQFDANTNGFRCPHCQLSFKVDIRE